MPTSDDNELDDMVRSAMKTLDDEAPSGYFEALPDLTLARLEGTMQHGPQGTMDKPATTPPPVGENTEDSGLHDIRNLAHSTKQRLSSKRITRSPSESENDVIASSSAGWKAVALPQPAKMVALPELTELPSKKDVLKAEKAAAKAEKAAVKADATIDAPVAKVAAAAVEAPAAAPSIAKRPAAPAKSKKGLYAVVGVAVAAAAGAAIFVATQSSKDKAPVVAQNTAAPAPQATPTVTPIETGAAAPSADVLKAQEELAKQQAEADRLKAELAAAQAAAPAEKADDKAEKAPVKAKGHATEKVETPVKKVEETKPAPDKSKDLKKPDGTTKSGDSADPDFNELLKEAGVKEQGPKKPVLAKKELTGDDFKQGMASITPAAKNCYKGTQGTVMAKIVISPSGKVSKVSVTGQFSGTPEGQCVASAIKGASFPPWDGGPASFSYPILLSE